MDFIKKKHIMVILTILILLLTPFTFIQVKKQISLNKVTEYLEEKGYSESEIKMIDSKWTTGIPNYYVKVIFANEPNIVYLYFTHDLKGQFEYYEVDGKTIPIEQLKNYDPAKNRTS